MDTEESWYNCSHHAMNGSDCHPERSEGSSGNLMDTGLLGTTVATMP